VDHHNIYIYLLYHILLDIRLYHNYLIRKRREKKRKEKKRKEKKRMNKNNRMKKNNRMMKKSR
jgi:uncharacterized membrane protein